MGVTVRPLVRETSASMKPVTTGLPSWLKQDSFIYRDKFPPPYEHAPHPRQMTVPYSYMAKLRNFHWRFYWETTPLMRGSFFALPIVLFYVHWIWLVGFFKWGKEKRIAFNEHNRHHEKSLAGRVQKEADWKAFGWTHGEFEH